jgi:acylphosphatase
MEKIKIIVKGKVQGVGFRYYVLKKAHELDLTGYTRNLPDGSVETVAEGGASSISKFLDAVKKGPPSAEVVEIAVELGKSIGEFPEFEIRR